MGPLVDGHAALRLRWLSRTLAGCAAAHEVAVVAATVVVVHEPAVDLGLELADAGEAPTVERGTPALLERGALESFAHRVVVRGTGWDPLVGEFFGCERVGERSGDVFGTVVGQHGSHGDAEPPVTADDVMQEPGGRRPVGDTEHDHDDRPAGRGVDRGELVDLPDAFEVPDVEAVDGDQVTGPGRPVAEPEQPVIGMRLR